MVDEEFSNLSKQYSNEYDDYFQTVIGLYAFCMAYCWDGDQKKLKDNFIIKIPSKFYQKGDAKKNILTPDGYVSNSSIPIIAEMKKHFKIGQSKYFDQLKKYDCELIDCWTQSESSNHDLVLLTHYLSSTNATDTYKKWKEDNKFDRNMAIVEFSYTNMGQTWFILALVEGEFSDNEFNEKLRTKYRLSYSLTLDLFRKYKFYDSRPPLIYTMQLIYDYILPSKIDENLEKTSASYKILIKVQEIRLRLQNMFVPKELNSQGKTIPDLSWIREACEKFVELNLAKKITKDEYIIELKTNIKDDTKEFLVKKIHQLNKNNKKKNQKNIELNLFD